MKTKHTSVVGLTQAFALSCALLGSLGTAQGGLVDLTTGPVPPGTSGIIKGAIFQSGSLDTATGSGVFDPFVRIHNSPVEEGFNTGNALRMPDVVGGSFNQEVQLSDLTVFDVGGTDYVRLALDLGEPKGGDKELLSLVDLRVYVRSTTVTDATNTTELFSGTPLYAFDVGVDRVDLNYALVSSGNGRSDMFLYLPETLFLGKASTDYFYLYSKFGNDGAGSPPYPAEGTFEEWGRDLQGAPIGDDPGPPPPIPEPTTMLFGGALLGVMGFARRRPR